MENVEWTGIFVAVRFVYFDSNSYSLHEKRVWYTGCRQAISFFCISLVVHIYVKHSTKIYTYSVKHTMVYSTTGFMVLLKSLFALGYESTLSDSKYAVNARIIFSCCISYFNWQFVLQFNPTVPPEQYPYQ